MLKGPKIASGLHMPDLTAGNLFLITAICQSVLFGWNHTGSLPDFSKSSKGQLVLDRYSLSPSLFFLSARGRLVLPVAKSTHSPETRSCRNSLSMLTYNLQPTTYNFFCCWWLVVGGWLYLPVIRFHLILTVSISTWK